MSDCQFCSQLFTTQGGQVPRILNCGHSICDDCVALYSNSGKIECIECKEVTELKNGIQLPLNYSVIRMIEEPQCAGHPDNWKRRRAATFFCYECNTVICTECSTSRAHRGHTLTPLVLHVKFYRNRLNTKKVFFEEELNTLKTVKERLEELNDKIFQTEDTQVKRLREALSNVLRFEGIQWYTEFNGQLLAVISNYKDDVVRKHGMVSDAIEQYEKAVVHLEEIEKFDGADLAFQEEHIVNLESFRVHHNAWGIPNAGLEIFHPVITDDKLHLRSMKFAICRDMDDSVVDKFSNYMRSHPAVFHVGPQQIVVYSPNDIFHMTFEKVKHAHAEPHTRMLTWIQGNKGKVHLYKERNNWFLSQDYNPDNMNEYVLTADGKKTKLGMIDENEALHRYWTEIVKLGNLVYTQDQMIHPNN